jgi:predicted nuclease with TOPRIM domain
MAGEKSNGHDPGTVAIIEALGRIETELTAFKEETRAGFQEVRGELSELRGELGAFKKDMTRALTEIHHEIADTNVRLEDLRGEVRVTNERLEDLRGEVHDLRGELKGPLEARVAKLEAVVFRPTGT